MKLLVHQDKIKDGKYFIELADEMGSGYMTLEAITASNQLYDETRDEVLIVTGIDTLIAASPDMYEALKELAEDMEAVIEAGDWFANCEALKMARQALAKAEGKEE